MPRLTDAEAERWLAERRKGFGGSDILDVLGDEEDGGCQRRMYYDKAGFQADEPESSLLLMHRGKALEDAAADLYESLTERRVDIPGGAFVHPARPWDRVNADRIIHKAGGEDGPGVLEIKTMGYFPFRRAKREGMKARHILQVQHAIGVTERKWGAFMVLHPDSWESFHFDVERDDALIDLIRQHTSELWQRISNKEPMPPKFMPNDWRCKGCRFANFCQGTANVFLYGLDVKLRAEELPLAPEFSEWLGEWDGAQAALKAATEASEALKERARELLAGRDGIECGGRRVYDRVHVRSMIDTAKLKKAYPDVAADCLKSSEVRTFRVY